jgi:hypothetical protein
MITLGKNERETVLGVDLEVGKQAEFLEDIVGKEMGFIDDEDGMDFLGNMERTDAILDLAEEGGTSALGNDTESVRDVGVEFSDGHGRVADIERFVQPFGQGGGEAAQETGFTGSGFAAEDADAAHFTEQGKDLEGGIDGFEMKKAIGLDFLRERIGREVEERKEFVNHDAAPC